MARCEQCEVMNINGIRCHESGCPVAWKEEVRECKWCGTEFVPEERHQDWCGQDCYCSYNDIPNPDEHISEHDE